MKFELPKALKPVWDYVFQVVVGAVLFAVVLSAAAGIGGLVYGIGILGFKPPWFVHAADVGEKVLFYVDLFTFGLFLLSETLKFIRSLFLEWREL